MNTPFFYDVINQYNSDIQMSTVDTHNNASYWYFKKYLLQRCMSVFDWTIPDNWDRRYLLYSLYQYGFVAVINTDKFGVIPQVCGLRGFNVFYEPTQAVILNPLFRHEVTADIGKNATLIRLQPDFSGALDIVNTYAERLALAFMSVDVNLINSKLAYILFADNKAVAETYKKTYDDISSGQPMVVMDKRLLNNDGSQNFNMFSGAVGQNYIVDKLLIDIRKIMNMFNTEIGIANSNVEKKERMITGEVEANDDETESISDLWFSMIKEDIEKTNAMFGTNISIEKHYKKKEGEPIERNVTNNKGNV